jgi:propionate CoA-transferase
MDPRLFFAEAMRLRETLEARPLADRLVFEEKAGVLFINFAGLAVHTEEDLTAIESTVRQCCAPLGRRVQAVVNYDGFTIAPQLMDAYAELVERLTERFYTKVTRYTSSAFLRLKLGHALALHHVPPEMFDSRRAAFRSLASAAAGADAPKAGNKS